jgi:hypothetical protein
MEPDVKPAGGIRIPGMKHSIYQYSSIPFIFRSAVCDFSVIGQINVSPPPPNPPPCFGTGSNYPPSLPAIARTDLSFQ